VSSCASGASSHNNKVTGGDLVAHVLHAAGVRDVFGVIGIHNIPIFDGIERRGDIRSVGARGEAGCVNMADAYARATAGLGVAVTSTGTGAGNAAGALIEALGAGTPLLHITGQIATSALDKHEGYIHETRDQLGMLRAVSKIAFRVESIHTLVDVLKNAITFALSAPYGPVSVEIPIDIQQAEIDLPAYGELIVDDRLPIETDPVALAEIVKSLARAKRPLLWLGKGASEAGEAARAFADAGWAVVTSSNGRAIVSETHPSSLGAFATYDAARAFYATCDAVLVVGSRLRGTDTLDWKLELPAARFRIDVNAETRTRSYATTFARGDATITLAALHELLRARQTIDPDFAADIARTKVELAADLDAKLGDYAPFAHALATWMPRDAIVARDASIANSVWATRYPPLAVNASNIHAAGGGIGQGLAMGIGAAIGARGRKTIALVGGGGLMLNLGELATLVQENADLLVIVMNDRASGTIRHMRYGKRYLLDELTTPDFELVARSLELPFARVADAPEFAAALAALGDRPGPAMIEADMGALGKLGGKFGQSQP
jgi:acetolactate synthase-1/2/3 large subunit